MFSFRVESGAVADIATVFNSLLSLHECVHVLFLNFNLIKRVVSDEPGPQLCFIKRHKPIDEATIDPATRFVTK